MLVFDIPLHAVSLFSFVLAIGIVVDDAIVVSEHIHLERKRGTPGSGCGDPGCSTNSGCR